MENESIEKDVSIVSKKDKWFAGYIVTGLIFNASQIFDRTTYDGFFIIVVSIMCGYFYHRLKNKIKLKNEGNRIIVTFLILELIAGFLIGAITRFF